MCTDAIALRGGRRDRSLVKHATKLAATPPTLELGTHRFLAHIFLLFFPLLLPPYFIDLLPQSCPYLQRQPSLQHPITHHALFPFLDTFRHASSPHRLLSGDRPASSSAVVLNCASSLSPVSIQRS